MSSMIRPKNYVYSVTMSLMIRPKNYVYSVTMSST